MFLILGALSLFKRLPQSTAVLRPGQVVVCPRLVCVRQTHTHIHTFVKRAQGVYAITWSPYPRAESECFGAFVGTWGLLAAKVRHLSDGATGTSLETLHTVDA